MKKTFKTLGALLLTLFVFSVTTFELNANSKYDAVIELETYANTGKFDVKVNSISIVDSYKDPEMFGITLEKIDDTKYLIIDASFKNVDTETAGLENGLLVIVFNGKEYKFNKPETFMDKKWGIDFDKINPLTTVRKKIVYKISDDITGKLYFAHGDAQDTFKIFKLGEIAQ